MNDSSTQWLSRQQAWQDIRVRIEEALAPSPWRLFRLDTEGARPRLRFVDVGGEAAELWIMPPREGERAYREGEGFLFGHGELPDSEGGRWLLDRVFELLDDMARDGVIALALAAIGGDHGSPAPSDQDVDGSFILRVTVACNERCVYCYNDDGSAAQAEDVRSPEAAHGRLVDARARGYDQVVITGGEPTLVPWLPGTLRDAASLGFKKILLQTNATLLTTAGLIPGLAEISGLILFISLPAHRAEVAAAVTGRPELHGPKVEGIRAALDAGLEVSINHVVCRQNMEHVGAFVQWLTDAFPVRRPALVFSFSLPAGRAWEGAEATIPRYSEAAGPILSGLRGAAGLGMKTHMALVCGIPTCVEPGLREFPEEDLSEFDPRVDPDRVRFPGCTTCPWGGWCPGVPRRYLDLYGVDEFVTLLSDEPTKE